MKRIRAHMVGVTQGSVMLFSDFEDDGDMWSGEGPRLTRKHVKFPEAFNAPPSVQVNMSMWDIDSRSNQRADISAEGITRSGFYIVFRTWGDTRVARVRADWMAIGEVRSEDDWDL